MAFSTLSLSECAVYASTTHHVVVDVSVSATAHCNAAARRQLVSSNLNFVVVPILLYLSQTIDLMMGEVMVSCVASGLLKTSKLNHVESLPHRRTSLDQ